jgi:hypothetical protein
MDLKKKRPIIREKPEGPRNLCIKEESPQPPLQGGAYNLPYIPSLKRRRVTHEKPVGTICL